MTAKLLPLHIKFLKCGLQVALDLLVRPCHQRTNLNLPLLATLIPKHPRDLPQRHSLLIANLRVNPYRNLINLQLHRHGRLALHDTLGQRGRDRRDGPVGVVVAADDAQAGLGGEELDAGFYPLWRRGGLGEVQVEAGLVELGGVGEGECCGGLVKGG